jgi:hypothetical protein
MCPACSLHSVLDRQRDMLFDLLLHPRLPINLFAAKTPTNSAGTAVFAVELGSLAPSASISSGVDLLIRLPDDGNQELQRPLVRRHCRSLFGEERTSGHCTEYLRCQPVIVQRSGGLFFRHGLFPFRPDPALRESLSFSFGVYLLMRNPRLWSARFRVLYRRAGEFGCGLRPQSPEMPL